MISVPRPIKRLLSSAAAVPGTCRYSLPVSPSKSTRRQAPGIAIVDSKYAAEWGRGARRAEVGPTSASSCLPLVGGCTERQKTLDGLYRASTRLIESWQGEQAYLQAWKLSPRRLGRARISARSELKLADRACYLVGSSTSSVTPHPATVSGYSTTPNSCNDDDDNIEYE